LPAADFPIAAYQGGGGVRAGQLQAPVDPQGSAATATADHRRQWLLWQLRERAPLLGHLVVGGHSAHWQSATAGVYCR